MWCKFYRDKALCLHLLPHIETNERILLKFRQNPIFTSQSTANRKKRKEIRLKTGKIEHNYNINN